jgi:hypothetical protein
MFYAGLCLNFFELGKLELIIFNVGKSAESWTLSFLMVEKDAESWTLSFLMAELS